MTIKPDALHKKKKNWHIIVFGYDFQRKGKNRIRGATIEGKVPVCYGGKEGDEVKNIIFREES